MKRPRGKAFPRLCRIVLARALKHDSEVRRSRRIRLHGASEFLCATAEASPTAAEVFQRLRWGGLFVLAGRSRAAVRELAERFEAGGFALPEGVRSLRTSVLPLPGRRVWYFVARKTHLVPPGQFTERFTHLVRLVRREDSGEWVVEKKVPDAATIHRRLKLKFPDIADEVLERRARKFSEKIFPVFLTREAAILRILQDYLPTPYRSRVPRVIDMEKDDRGFVQTFRMTWLRNSLKPISQMEFARQSADLLRVVHDVAHVIHLDLRMDNMVITDDGVGFVDFGSAVRDDEDLQQSPLLSSLFGELMKTSQIQRMLEKMTVSGAVTSEVIRNGYQKVDKAVDFFYLAVQFNQPHDNPELAPLIRYDPTSVEATDLRRLTDSILRPRDPQRPAFRSAKDIMHGIERMMLHLDPPELA